MYGQRIFTLCATYTVASHDATHLSILEASRNVLFMCTKRAPVVNLKKNKDNEIMIALCDTHAREEMHKAIKFTLIFVM